MKLRLVISILAASAAFSMLAQEPAKVPVKTGATSNLIHHEDTANVPVSVAPPLNTSRIWRLVSKAQALRVQVEATDAAKAAKEAEAELQAEQGVLNAKCAAAGMTLGYDENKASATYQDLICVPKPKEQASAPSAPQTVPAKEK